MSRISATREKNLQIFLLFLPYTRKKECRNCTEQDQEYPLCNSRDTVSLLRLLLLEVFLCETQTSSHQKASKKQSETKRNGKYYASQFRQKESSQFHAIKFSYQGYTKIRAEASASKKVFLWCCPVYIFIKISRDGRGAMGSTSSSKFKDTDT